MADFGSSTRLLGVMAPMSDGIGLATDIALPAAEGSWPAILVRTPYSRTSARLAAYADYFTGRGYAFVAQDVRGRGDSSGQWTVWSSEFDDGYDTVEWIADQPWSDGQVGMLGGSYEAWVQWGGGSRRPLHLTAMATSSSPGWWFRDWPFRFGAFHACEYMAWLGLIAERTVQSMPFPSWAWAADHPDLRTLDCDAGRSLQAWQDVLAHSSYDDYWHSLDITGHERMNIPVLHVTGWWDVCAPGQLRYFSELRAKSPAAEQQTLVVGPWDYKGTCLTGDPVDGALEVGTKGKVDMLPLWERWFSKWLKRDEADNAPKVRYFCLGINDWMESETWPPSPSHECSLYLCGDGRLAETPDEEASARFYDYDPMDPIYSAEDLHHRRWLEWAPRRELSIAKRKDVLRYSTGHIEKAITIAGPVRAVLFASSTSIDTDFIVSLIYVPSDGPTAIISDGIVRAAMRASLSAPAWLEPGQVYEIQVELNDLALHLDMGDELHLVVSSSLVPKYHPNPNTGKPLTARWDPLTARQTIQHGSAFPSRLDLCTHDL